MAQYGFGSGILWGTPLQDAFGTAIANPTPVIFGVLQEASVDFDFEQKKLHGQNQFPVAVARGKGSISGKAKFAQLNGATMNSLFFGQTQAAGTYSAVYDTVGAAIPTTPFTITIAPPSSGVFAADLGVVNDNGVPMTRVAAAPAVNQYMVNTTTGVYTFATVDVGRRVFINYRFTATSTVAQRLTISNVAMGQAPTFRVDLFQQFQGQRWCLTLPAAVSTKMSLATKLDDFLMPEFEFEAYADATNNVATFGLSE